MIEIGKYNKLKILRQTSVGLYLDENSDGIGILLPQKYVPEHYEIDGFIEVFVYKDSEDRIIATTLKPFIELNQFECLQVIDVTNIGAFLDWGLEKDLLVPFHEQPGRMKPGDWYVVYLYLDDVTQRLAASARVGKFLNNETLSVAEGDEVDIMIWEPTDLGVNVIVNNKHKGLVYKNEIFQAVTRGDRLKGYVHKIREDNKLDIRLGKKGYDNVEPNAQIILDILKENNGILKLGDKSEPADIYSQLGMSKKIFKKAIGGLYKQKLITIGNDTIAFVKADI
jgi:predicted RNA-binding protein (virulence factor B family)